MIWCSGRFFFVCFGNSNELLGSTKSEVFLNWPDDLLKHRCCMTFPHVCHITQHLVIQFCLISLPKRYSILFGIQIVKLFILQYVPSSSYFLYLKHKYLPQDLIIKHVLPTFILNVSSEYSLRMNEQAKFTFPYIISMFLIQIPNGKTKDSRLKCSRHSLDLIRSQLFHE